jgi:hypothetical protein
MSELYTEPPDDDVLLEMFQAHNNMTYSKRRHDCYSSLTSII